MQSWLYLLAAIGCEVAATTSLKASEGFTRPWPSLVVVVGYAASFYLLSRVLQAMPVGVAYAVWSGLGVVLVALVGWLFLGQALDLPAVAGMALIVAGVVVLNLYSRAAPH